MDLSKLSDSDLIALHNKDLKSVSDEGLKYLHAQQTAASEPEVKPDTGFTGAFKSSKEQLLADYERLKGKLGFKSAQEAEAEAQKHEETAKKVFKPTEEGWLEAPWTKLKETAGGSFVEGLSNILTLKTLGAGEGFKAHIASKEKQTEADEGAPVVLPRSLTPLRR